MANAGNFLGGGEDPRISIDAGAPGGPIAPQQRLLHDPAVSFDEYHYYALRTRAEEDSAQHLETGHKTGILQIIFPPKNGPSAVSTTPPNESPGNDEKRQGSVTADTNLTRIDQRLHISNEEWTNASRALRTATWAACFYLITTDILGPFGIGFAIGTLGWGPGIALFTVFGLAAGYGGYLLWISFLGLDSYEFPLRNYGDLAFRIYGSIPRHFVNILQSIQLLCSVGLIVISNGQAISQVSKFRLCYAVCCLIWAICGFGLGQVRTLQRFGWLANVAIWINLMIMFISMGTIAHSPPNYSVAAFGSAGATTVPADVTPDANGVFPPVKHYAGLPNPSSLIGSINGLMQGVYAYSGAQLFIEFMAEMRRPRDFIKAMWGAQCFIYIVYMFYGCFVYGYQGQYTYSLAYLGVSPYGWQTVGNMLAVLSGIIAAALYGNIGIKVLYNNVLMDLFNAPPLTTKKGKILWATIVPIYWSIAYIVAAAIPDFFGLVSVVAAFCAVQFTYSFPPILALGYIIHKGAMRPDENFDPATGQVTHFDSGLRRWARGFMKGPWYFSVLNVIHIGAALATAGLGAYAAIMGMIAAFKDPQVNAFSCHSPLDSS
ncbi:oligopeptide transporter protein [Lepidopterella palustris CBS 459.81]|uniref:Oligopeptide transporter protein n=1 Tax=Lepidopterella palustris CBS 459.81 TaxID=1314670 RepID=A0A8E2E017_9PEZI|nr:oligopeptide transporter protein [Lepidopterella palustris CBS 459.81]